MDVVIEDRPFAAVADFHQAISRAFQFSLPDTSMRWPASLVDVKSDYFQLYMEVSLGEARIEVKSIMDRRDRGAPVIISREVAMVVPASLPAQSPEKLSCRRARLVCRRGLRGKKYESVHGDQQTCSQPV